MKIQSLDPRINRIELPEENNNTRIPPMDQWQTYEVFHQQARGDQHKHVGIVHAPNPEMALLFAKEQYARRSQCVNLWVVRTADVYATSYDDADIFEPAFDKSYRESWGYKDTRQLIEKFKKEKEMASPATPTSSSISEENHSSEETSKKKVVGKSGIIIGKK
ncbi:MAG: hypothetical protein RML72_02685 [Bacteroidia bacterium]|nr:hypothetical protein [Bacteroidia bacterium]MDW8157767.1 hypothetical protein [Bacteroidia bacterium]